MNREGQQACLDAPLAHGPDHGVAVAPLRQDDAERLVVALGAGWRLLEFEFSRQGPSVDRRELAATGDDVVEALDLRKAERGGHFGHAEVSGGHDELTPKLTMVAQHAELIGEVAVIGEAHAAFTGGEDLARVKAQARDLPEASTRAIRESAAERARRIFDDRERPESVADLGGPGGVTELIDDDGDLAGSTTGVPKSVRSAVPLAWVDVDEANLRAGNSRRVRRARPAECGAEHLVACTDLENFECELKRGGAARDGDRMLASDQGSDRMLEALDERSLHEHPRLENGGDGALLVLSNPWFREANQSSLILPASAVKPPDCGALGRGAGYPGGPQHPSR